MVIKNSVSTDIISTFVNSINILDCCLSGVQLLFENCGHKRQSQQGRREGVHIKKKIK